MAMDPHDAMVLISALWFSGLANVYSMRMAGMVGCMHVDMDHGDIMGLSCGFIDSGDGWLKAMMVNRSGFFVGYPCIVHDHDDSRSHMWTAAMRYP